MRDQPLGPDATGVGWVYEYALVDRTGSNDLSQLRSIQDWFLKFRAANRTRGCRGGNHWRHGAAVPGGGRSGRIAGLSGFPGTNSHAIQRGNREVGGSVIEMGEAEYMVRATGYLTSIEDLQDIPLGHERKRYTRELAGCRRNSHGAAAAPGYCRTER